MSTRKNFYSLKPAERKAIATHCGIKRSYLSNLISTRDRYPSLALAAKIEAATKGHITRRELRPDLDWNIIEGQY